MSAVPKFGEMNATVPNYDEIEAEFQGITARLESAEDAAGRAAALAEWDTSRRRLDSTISLIHLHFNQNTRDDAARQAREAMDELAPKLTALEVKMKRGLLEGGHRAEYEAHFGAQAFSLWEQNIRSFDPAIESDLVTESKLEAEYVELTAAAEIEFQGERYNLSEISKFNEDPDRDVRHGAQSAVWKWFGENGDELDRIYGDLVTLRHSMAKKLGLSSFTELGYLRMNRIDYNEADVDNFRAQVREFVVPLCARIREEQAKTLGVDSLRFWDEPIFDPKGNPAPKGDHDWMLQQAQTMFDQLGQLGEFFRLMEDRELLDLKCRDGKAGGGFCTSFPSYGVPYIFANFNGTKGDVEVFTHEAGHAFQCWKSQSQPVYDYLWPTTESCEIHSMSLEFLTWPHMELFFGDDADRFRRIHLLESLLFLPYGVAVDHFQHEVYANPEASAADRHAMWKKIEATYLPWREYGDIDRLGMGGLWQRQRHIYLIPFYYIDYTLALTCAMQFWVKAENDATSALRDYEVLCARGGEAPFQELARSAGLVSPFDDGCLTQVVSQAREFLGL